MKQLFQPGPLAVLFNPFYFTRRDLFTAIRKEAVHLEGSLLDFGCGRKPYENLFRVKEYIGTDVRVSGHDHRHSKVDVFYDGNRLPFDDNRFDSVFSSEVLEHLPHPGDMLDELARVLKPGGRILVTVPFSWNEHEAPYDFTRFTSFGLRNIFEEAGFNVLRLRKSGNFARVIFQLWALYFFELFKKWKRTGYCLAMLFILPVNITGLILLLFLPRERSLYFNNIILAEKPSNT